MNRVEIKEKAKEMIKGKKWYLWKPLVMFMLIMFVVSFVISLILTLFKLSTETATAIVSVITGFMGIAYGVGYAHYVLEFVRGNNNLDWKEALDFAKKHWVNAIVVSIIVGIICAVGSILLVIPGIIAGIGLMFYEEVVADNPELSPIDLVKKSWNVTKGHKWDLFIFGLSFFGWIILAEMTLGILMIWLMPYMVVALTLAYEKLRSNAA